MTLARTLPRIVAAETLDSLVADDPAAMRSRRDLQRIHRVMGTRSIVTRALRKHMASSGAGHAGRPLRILELGAGDGSLLLGVARALRGQWPAVELTLLDRQELVSGATVASYAEAGWRATSLTGDVFDWAAGRTGPDQPDDQHAASRWDLIVANLFLHHFEAAQLRSLLNAISTRCTRFFACEPRRAYPALAASHLVALIGANAVTREDAVLSVHAGFRGTELSQAWPAPTVDWTLDEYAAGPFSHCFCALRRVPAAAAAA